MPQHTWESSSKSVGKEGNSGINIEVKLIIEDNGVGISKEDLPYIFNVFINVTSLEPGRVGAPVSDSP